MWSSAAVPTCGRFHEHGNAGSTGWGALGQVDLPDSMFKIEAAPHGWFIPQMAAVVHHGGAGTTGTALQSGTPSIVVPSFADQFFWGERVAALGVGTTLPRRRLTAESLSEAIASTSESRIRAEAATFGERLRSEDGVTRAVEQVAEYVGA